MLDGVLRPIKIPFGNASALVTDVPFAQHRTYSISRWAVGRYRFRMHAYGVDYLSEVFREFIQHHALTLQAFLDGAPMKLFHEGRSVNVEVYCRMLLARDASGACKRSFPVLAIPPDSTAAGILSILPLRALRIEDFALKPGFKFLLINCDGANTNRKAVRILMSELQWHRDLLVVVISCTAHAMNRAAKWGLGVFYYGDFLRCCHVLQAVKHRNFGVHVRNMLMSPVLGDSQLMGQTAQDYMQAVQFQYGHARGIDECYPQPAHSSEPPHAIAEPELPSENILWRRLVRLVLGDRGPFTKRSKTNAPSLFYRVCVGFLFACDSLYTRLALAANRFLNTYQFKAHVKR